MLPILTSAEMRSCDERTINEFGIPSLALMEAAARGSAKALEEYIKIKKKNVLILCGKGNNGGDGFALARYLQKRGAHVTICFIGIVGELQGDALANYRRAVKNHITIIRNPKTSVIISGSWDVIVDALLGTGARLPLQEKIAGLVEVANAYRCFKFSIDIPTGIDTDRGVKDGVAFDADATATMAALKPGLLISEGRKHAGEITVIDIGTPQVLLDPEKYSLRFPEEEDIITRIPVREIDANKYSVGKLFLLCGSRGMSGAAAMAAQAGMRAGAGISILAVPKSQQSVLAQKLTVTMTMPVAETEEGRINDPGLVDLGAYAEWGNANVVGCGLSRDERTNETVRNFVSAATAPIVLDADGLLAFTNDLNQLSNAKQALILTPHHGELAHLIGMEREAIERNPIETAKNVARRLKCVLVLKGAPTIVASPEGVVYINPTGNPGMATAGSGDVLAGIIGGLLAQGSTPLDAALRGVYLHGLAGDIAAERLTQYTMIATDIIESLPEAFKKLLND